MGNAPVKEFRLERDRLALLRELIRGGTASERVRTPNDTRVRNERHVFMNAARVPPSTGSTVPLTYFAASLK